MPGRHRGGRRSARRRRSPASRRSRRWSPRPRTPPADRPGRRRGAAARRRTSQHGELGRRTRPGPAVGVFGDAGRLAGRGVRRRPPATRLLYGFAEPRGVHHLPGHLDRGAPALRPSRPVRVELNTKTRRPGPLGVGRARDRRLHRRRPARAGRRAVTAAGLGCPAGRLPAGRYETILPPSAMADLLIDLYWRWPGARRARGAQRVLATPGGGDPGRRAAHHLPLTLSSDPHAGHGLTPCRSWPARTPATRSSVFDNGAPLGRDRLDRGRHGRRAGLPARRRRRVRHPVAAPAAPLLSDNLVLPPPAVRRQPPARRPWSPATQRGLLLTCLWYIRAVDPETLLLTGLTRDGVYLVEAARSSARSTTSGSTRARWTCCAGSAWSARRSAPCRASSRTGSPAP